MRLLPSIDRNLKLFFLADIITQFGSGMSFVGLNWFLLAKTGMNAKVGLMLTIGIVSGLVVLPVAGPLVDRFDRKSVLIFSNFARAFFIAAVLVLLMTGPYRDGYIYFLAAVGGVGWNVYLTASRAFVQEIVSEKDLLKGNAFVETSLQVGMFTAAAAAGVLYHYFGIALILAVDAATFVASNVLLLRIRGYRAVEQAEREGFFLKLMRGYRYLIERPVFFVFGVVLFLPFIATMTSNVVLPGYVRGHLHAGAVTYGLLDMAYGAGACVSGFVVIYLTRRWPKRAMLPFFFGLSIASLLFLSVNKTAALACVATMLFGLPNSAIRVMLNAVAMEIVDKAYMGRVMSIWNFVSTLLQFVSVSLVGMAMDRAGPLVGVGAIAAIMALAFAGYLCFMLAAGRCAAAPALASAFGRDKAREAVAEEG